MLNLSAISGSRRTRLAPLPRQSACKHDMRTGMDSRSQTALVLCRCTAIQALDTGQACGAQPLLSERHSHTNLSDEVSSSVPGTPSIDQALHSVIARLQYAPMRLPARGSFAARP
jgi:hypothetical protein